MLSSHTNIKSSLLKALMQLIHTFVFSKNIFLQYFMATHCDIFLCGGSYLLIVQSFSHTHDSWAASFCNELRRHVFPLRSSEQMLFHNGSRQSLLYSDATSCACSIGFPRPGISNKWSIWTFHFLYALPLRDSSIFAFHRNVFHNCCTHIFAHVPHCEVFACGRSYNPLYWKPSHTYHIWNFLLLRGSWKNVNQDFFYSHNEGDNLGMESSWFRVLNERC